MIISVASVNDGREYLGYSKFHVLASRDATAGLRHGISRGVVFVDMMDIWRGDGAGYTRGSDLISF